jgi:hypothetical protein
LRINNLNEVLKEALESKNLLYAQRLGKLYYSSLFTYSSIYWIRKLDDIEISNIVIGTSE